MDRRRCHIGGAGSVILAAIAEHRLPALSAIARTEDVLTRRPAEARDDQSLRIARIGRHRGIAEFAMLRADVAPLPRLVTPHGAVGHFGRTGTVAISDDQRPVAGEGGAGRAVLHRSAGNRLP